MPTSPLSTPIELINYGIPMIFNLKSLRFNNNSVLEALEIYCIQSGLIDLLVRNFYFFSEPNWFQFYIKKIANDSCQFCEKNEITYYGSLRILSKLSNVKLVSGYNQIHVNFSVNEQTVIILRYNGKTNNIDIFLDLDCAIWILNEYMYFKGTEELEWLIKICLFLTILPITMNQTILLNCSTLMGQICGGFALNRLFQILIMTLNYGLFSSTIRCGLSWIFIWRIRKQIYQEPFEL